MITADGEWCLPTQTVALPAHFSLVATEVLSGETLWTHLRRHWLSPDIADALSPDARVALGIEELGSSHLLRLVRAISTADDESNDGVGDELTERGATLVAVLLLLYRVPGFVESVAATTELRTLRCIPLERGGENGDGYGAAVDGPIYFPPRLSDQAARLSCTFAHELRVVSSSLLEDSGRDPLQRAVLVRMLRVAHIVVEQQ